MTVYSQSDDLGILGIDDGVPAGPLSVSVRVKVGSNGNEPGRVREIVTWAHDHCPLCDVTKRAVPIELEIEVD